MQKRHIVVEGGISCFEGCTVLSQRGVGCYKQQIGRCSLREKKFIPELLHNLASALALRAFLLLFSESDSALPRKLIHSCGAVLVLSASATLAHY